MNKKLIMTLLSLSLISCTSETELQEQWVKGNLHTHSYWSDGDDFPEMIMDWYKEHDYQFVALSDHNVLADTVRWKRISPERSEAEAYGKYLEKYGEEWVEEQRDSAGNREVRLKTLEEYRPLFEEEGAFLIVQSEEISDGYDKKPIHMNAANIREKITPQGGNSVAEVMQHNLDALRAQSRRLGIPMLFHINHPNFYDAIAPEDFFELEGERFFEVYNGHPLVRNEGGNGRPSTEELWDLLLLNSVQNGEEIIYGLAVDDAHNYHAYNIERSNPGRGWVEVACKELSAEAIIEAMEAGRFYSSTGVELKRIATSERRYEIEVLPEKGVEYKIQFIGTKRSAPEEPGIILQETEGHRAEYRIVDEDMYVRGKIISSKGKENPYAEGEKERAWTQPVRGRE